MDEFIAFLWKVWDFFMDVCNKVLSNPEVQIFLLNLVEALVLGIIGFLLFLMNLVMYIFDVGVDFFSVLVDSYKELDYWVWRIGHEVKYFLWFRWIDIKYFFKSFWISFSFFLWNIMQAALNIVLFPVEVIIWFYWIVLRVIFFFLWDLWIFLDLNYVVVLEYAFFTFDLFFQAF